MILNCRGKLIEISEFEIDACPLLKAYIANNYSDNKSAFYVPFEKSAVHNFLNYLHQADELVDFAKLNSICKYFGVDVTDKHTKIYKKETLNVLDIIDMRCWFIQKVKFGGDLYNKFIFLIEINYDKYFESKNVINIFGKTFGKNNWYMDLGRELINVMYDKKIKENDLFDSDNLTLKMIREDILLFYNRYKDTS